MKDKTVWINGERMNLNDILEISEIVHKNESSNLPWGFSIVLKDHSIINVIGNSNENRELKVSSTYQIIKQHLCSKDYVPFKDKEECNDSNS